MDRFVSRFSHAGAAAWLAALEVPEIRATIEKPGAWIRSHFNGYSRERGWQRKTQWHVALLQGDLPRAIELFRINERRNAAARARKEAEDMAAQARAGWHQVRAEHPELAAAMRGVEDAWRLEKPRPDGGKPVTGYGALPECESAPEPQPKGAPRGAVGLVPAPVRI